MAEIGRTGITQVIASPDSLGEAIPLHTIHNPSNRIASASLGRCLAMTVIFACGFLISQAWACPMCSELIERGKDAVKAWGFGKGIAWSILLLLSMPMLLVGGVTLVVIRAHRQSLKNKQGR